VLGPPERKVPERPCPPLTVEVKDFVEAILTDDKTAPRKQRHSAHRIWQRVRDELAATVGGSTVRASVAQQRRELGIGQTVFVPQHAIAAQAEADFYEADFDFPWGRQTANIIVVRSEFSAGARHVAYPARTRRPSWRASGLAWASSVVSLRSCASTTSRWPSRS
jgi:hypothetical protein